MGRHLSNLPAEVTSFVGRRQELREVKRLLSTTRLLTLTGSGGVGKTKLALRAAAEMSRGFPDGACLVLLDSVRDPLLVPQAVFGALGVPDLSSGMSLSSLADYLAGQHLLLVLDNCEHLLDACATLAGTLLAACPDVHILATSRQALGVAAEVRMVVPSMSLPAEGDGTSVQSLLGCDSVWLLSERAAAASPGFTVDAANAGQVLLLCRKLDGIPLALELAAVRLASLSLDRLNKAGETDTTAKRHFDWICGLARLAGAWDGRQPETFARMASEHDNLWAALDFCSRQPDELAAAAEAVQHLMAFWACRGPFGDVRRRLTALAELTPEDSLPRAQLLWVASVMAASQNDYDAAAVLSGESLRIGIETRDVEVVAWSLLRDAWSRWPAGDLAGSTRQLESALSLARLMRIERAELDILNDLCATCVAAGELDRAVEFGEQGLAISKHRGELFMRGYLLASLAQASWLRGEGPRAEVLARDAVACKHAIDDRHGLNIVLGTLAWIAAECGQLARAATLLGSAQRVRDESSVALIELFRPQHERTVAIIIRAVGQKAFDAAFARGRAMTIAEGVAFATEGQQAAKPSPAVKPASDTELTRRQLEIARLIAEDLTNRQIADRLFCLNGPWKLISRTCSTSSA